MKKLSKIILSICMAFVVSLSLVACDGLDDSNNNGGGNSGGSSSNGDTVTFTKLAQNLYENHDYKSPYLASIVKQEDGNEVINIMKYTYNDGVAQIAIYDSENVMKDYYEIETVVANSLYKIRTYNLTNKTYEERSCTETETNAHKANLYLAEKAIMFLYQIEFNQGYNIGDDVPFYDGVNIILSETLTNPTNGKYVLTRKVTAHHDNETMIGKFELTCVNNKTTKLRATRSDTTDYIDVGYEYKSVTINFNKTGYTKVS